MEILRIYSTEVTDTPYITGIERYYKIGSRRFKSVFRTGTNTNVGNSLYEYANGEWNFCDDYKTVGLEEEWERSAGPGAMAFGIKLIALFEDKITNFYL